MTLRTAHGKAARLGSLVVVEGCPVDELPAGLPDPNPCPPAGRDGAGRFVAGDPATIAAAAAAGRAKRERTALAHTLGVTSDDPVWRDALAKADAFRKMQVRILASTVGGGRCGPAPAALVGCAARALAASIVAYSQGNAVMGARLGDSVKGHLLGAHELAAREAQSRPRAPTDPLAAWMRPASSPALPAPATGEPNA